VGTHCGLSAYEKTSDKKPVLFGEYCRKKSPKKDPSQGKQTL